MKFWLLLLLLIAPQFALAQKLEFKFSNANGRTYSSTGLTEQLEKEYGFKINPTLILIETPNFKNNNYQKQTDILSQIDSEEFQIISVVACPSEKYQHGYHVGIIDSAKLMSDQEKFHIRVLTGNGIVILESYDVVPKVEIEKIAKSKGSS